VGVGGVRSDREAAGWANFGSLLPPPTSSLQLLTSHLSPPTSPLPPPENANRRGQPRRQRQTLHNAYSSWRPYSAMFSSSMPCRLSSATIICASYRLV